MSGKNIRFFLLRWFPEKNAFSESDFEFFFNIVIGGGEVKEFAWKIEDWKKVRAGDAFILIRCGTPNDGVVMHGVFTTECFLNKFNEDGTPKKNTRDNKTHSAFLSILGMYKDNGKLYSTVLAEKFPQIDWNAGPLDEILPTQLGIEVINYIENAVLEQQTDEDNNPDADT